MHQFGLAALFTLGSLAGAFFFWRNRMTLVDRITGIETSVAVKAPCVVATTANITLSGTQTINGVRRR